MSPTPWLVSWDCLGCRWIGEILVHITEMRSEQVMCGSEEMLHSEAGHELRIMVQHLAQTGLDIYISKTRAHLVFAHLIASWLFSLFMNLTSTVCSQQRNQSDPFKTSIWSYHSSVKYSSVVPCRTWHKSQSPSDGWQSPSSVPSSAFSDVIPFNPEHLAILLQPIALVPVVHFLFPLPELFVSCTQVWAVHPFFPHLWLNKYPQSLHQPSSAKQQPFRPALFSHYCLSSYIIYHSLVDCVLFIYLWSFIPTKMQTSLGFCPLI